MTVMRWIPIHSNLTEIVEFLRAETIVNVLERIVNPEVRDFLGPVGLR